MSELFNDNFLKENEKLLFNYVQKSNKNIRSGNNENSSTKYSTKGFYKEGSEIKNINSSYKLNETLKSKELKKLNLSKNCIIKI